MPCIDTAAGGPPKEAVRASLAWTYVGAIGFASDGMTVSPYRCAGGRRSPQEADATGRTLRPFRVGLRGHPPRLTPVPPRPTHAILDCLRFAKPLAKTQVYASPGPRRGYLGSHMARLIVGLLALQTQHELSPARLRFAALRGRRLR